MQRKKPELKQEFISRMQEILTDKKDFDSYINILKEMPVRSIRCNTLKISPKELKQRLEKNGWKIIQPWKDYPEVMIVEGKMRDEENIEVNNKPINNKNPIRGVSALTNSPTPGVSLGGWAGKSNLNDLSPGELGRSIEHVLGYYYVQELASMLPIIALQPKPEEKFLDLCASPGSKTTQASAKMQNKGTIIANEVSMGRLSILASNLERCGVANAIITRKEGSALCKRFKDKIKFSKILVDAPCSGEGTLRSSLQTYIMWNVNTIKQLSKIQKQLAESAFELLKKDGEMIYSTCTHAPEENEEIVDYLLNKFKDEIEIVKINLPIKTRPGIIKWKDKTYNENVKLACRVYPQDNNTEGFFISKFRRIK